MLQPDGGQVGDGPGGVRVCGFVAHGRRRPVVLEGVASPVAQPSAVSGYYAVAFPETLPAHSRSNPWAPAGNASSSSLS